MVGAEVEQVLRRKGSEGLPEAMPKTIQAATSWLLDYLIDPPDDDESIRRMPAFTGFAWRTPYRDRAVYLAGKFLSLPESEQRSIIAYRKDGIRWRGDDAWFLALLAAETLKIQSMEAGKLAAYLGMRPRIAGSKKL